VIAVSEFEIATATVVGLSGHLAIATVVVTDGTPVHTD